MMRQLLLHLRISERVDQSPPETRSHKDTEHDGGWCQKLGPTLRIGIEEIPLEFETPKKDSPL
jgi:hypothetical protein